MKTRRKSRTRAASLGPVDQQDRITADVFCLECGENLRSRLATEACSNCGHPNSDSVWGDYLIHTGPAEVRRLHDAATLVLFGAGLTSAIIVLATIATLTAASSLVDAVERSFNMLFAGAMISPIVASTGLALLTRRRSIAYYRAKYSNPRRFSKPLALLAAFAIALSIGAIYAGWVLEKVLLIAWATVPSAMFLRGLSRLMRSMPNHKLANYSIAACAGVYVAGGLTLILKLARPLAVDDPDWEGPMLALLFVLTLGGFTLAGLSLRLMVLVRRSIRAIGG